MPETTKSPKNLFEEYVKAAAAHREKVMADLPNDSVLVLYSGKPVERNPDVEYPFRVDSQFCYMTGAVDPDMTLILSKDSAGKIRSLLLHQPDDAEARIWTGARDSSQQVADKYHVELVAHNTDLAQTLARACEGKTLYCDRKALARYPEYSAMLAQIKQDERSISTRIKEKVSKWLRRPTKAHLNDASAYIHEARKVKDATEIKVLAAATEVSIQMHRAAMRRAKSAFDHVSPVNERDLDGVANATMHQHGSHAVGYSNIVAAGKNGCVLHYEHNRADIAHRHVADLSESDLVLMDMGAEAPDCGAHPMPPYTADITTTFPVNGHFSERQAEIYNIVRAAQLAAIALIKPGVSLGTVFDAATRKLTEGLLVLGILEGDLETLIKDKAHLPYCPHGIGHWLGLDVHDVGSYHDESGALCKLEPGHVLTIEPGLYFGDQKAQQSQKTATRQARKIQITESGYVVDSDNPARQTARPATDKAKQYAGIGIRLEHNIVVTEEGYTNLTAAMETDVSAVEVFLAQKNSPKVRC